MKRIAFSASCAALALATGAPGFAQSYGPERSADATEAKDAPAARGGRQVALQPYIEVSQVVTAELSPGDDVVTYTQVAAGVDAVLAGRNNGASVSVRYERNISYDDDVADSNVVSGVARGYATVVPNALTVEAGALASRTRVESDGRSSINGVTDTGNESRVYSAYAGPNLHTRAGDVEVNANYRVGYTKVEAPDAAPLTPGNAPVDIFDDSVVQSANVHAATRPGEPLPVGVGVGAGFFQEDVGNLDQRVRDVHVRADVTVPVSPGLAVVGGVGYEDVEVSSRDALFDASGRPVVDSSGRLVTDGNSPRVIAYDTSGLIWDAGVVWRPSSRTAFEAHLGRRYDSTTYYGSFAWAPDSRSAVNVSVYDGLSGFGGTLNSALVALPTDFVATRNGVTGDLGGCVASLEGNNCLSGVFASVRSSVFRSRGIAATYARTYGRMSAGIGVGYDRRKFIAAPGPVLAAANGTVDESTWATAYVSGEIGQRGAFTVNTYANWLQTGTLNGGDALLLGTSAAYSHNILAGLSARAAVALDHVDSDVTGDIRTASGLLGLRYDF